VSGAVAAPETGLPDVLLAEREKPPVGYSPAFAPAFALQRSGSNIGQVDI